MVRWSLISAISTICFILTITIIVLLMNSGVMGETENESEIEQTEEKEKFQVCLTRLLPIRRTSCFMTDSMQSVAKNITKEYGIIDISNHSIPIIRKGDIFNIALIRDIYIDNCSISELGPGSFQDVKYKSISLDNNNLTRIDQGVFTGNYEINAIYIRFNMIEFIHKDAFANMSFLQGINLIENRLKYWNPDWFANGWLATIHFANNLIEELPDSSFAFPNVPPLILNFNNNSIKRISKNTFKGATAVNSLLLAGNQLTEFGEDWLADTFLYWIDLSDNKIECLPQNLTHIMKGLCTIYKNNPYNCSCVNRLRAYAKKNNKCYQDSLEGSCD